MRKTEVIYINYDSVRKEEKEYATRYSCYQINDSHVVSFDQEQVIIDPITEITDEGLIVRWDDERPVIVLDCEYVDESNIVDNEVVRFLKYLIKVKDKK